MRKMFAIGCLVLGMGMVGCASWFQRGPGGTPSTVEQIAGGVAPLLPPPWGLLVGGLATVLTGAASVGANAASNKAFKEKKKPSLLVSLTTDHSWAYPALGALAAFARASGYVHFSDAELAMMLTTLTTPVATKKVMRKPVA